MTIRHCLIAFISLFTVLARPLLAQYSPDHPVVKEMVERGVAYLENQQTANRSAQWGPGAAVLVGLAVYKVRNDADHPIVQRGIQAALAITRSATDEAAVRADDKVIYYASMAAILLASVDVDQYRSQCVMLRDFLLRHQRDYGAFGYLEGASRDRGDTSQTQYGMLALWTLDQLGVPVDPEPVERLTNWLQVTQDPTGGWGYQGIVGRGSLVAQEGVSTSLTMAGMCSMLIAGDFLGFYRNRLADAEGDDVPRAFRRVFDDKDKMSRKQTSMRRDQTDGTIERGSAWMAKNPFSRANANGWNYYARYSEERMESFLEIARNRPQKSPAWYNVGVEDLRKFQAESGGWGTQAQIENDNSPAGVCTAFSILYLIRSTQKAIGALNEDILDGGRGNLGDVANARRVNGKIIDKSQINSMEEMLKTLEAEGTANADDAIVSERLKLDPDPKRRKDQLNRLSRLLVSGDARARRTSARLLGRGDDLDFVPTLIFALSDPDSLVPKYAETALQVLSRKITTRYIPLEGQPTGEQRKLAEQKWKEWFLNIRPDHVFVEPK